MPPEHALHRNDYLGAGIHRALPNWIHIIDLKMKRITLRFHGGMPMLGEGITQHERTAIHIQMNVHETALIVGRRATDFFGAECADVEVCRLGRTVDLKIGRDAPENLNRSSLEGSFGVDGSTSAAGRLCSLLILRR